MAHANPLCAFSGTWLFGATRPKANPAPAPTPAPTPAPAPTPSAPIVVPASRIPLEEEEALLQGLLVAQEEPEDLPPLVASIAGAAPEVVNVPIHPSDSSLGSTSEYSVDEAPEAADEALAARADTLSRARWILGLERSFIQLERSFLDIQRSFLALKAEHPDVEALFAAASSSSSDGDDEIDVGPVQPPPKTGASRKPYLKGEANIRLFSEHVEEVARRLNVVDGVMLPPPGGCPGARAARNAIREAFATLPPPLDVVLAGVPATAQRAMVSSYMHGHRPWPTAAVAYVTKWVAEARAAGRLAPAGAKPRMSQIHALTGDLYRAVGLYVGAVRLPAIVHRYFDAGRQDELTFINPIILGRRRGAKRATPQAQPEGASKAKKARLQ